MGAINSTEQSNDQLVGPLSSKSEVQRAYLMNVPDLSSVKQYPLSQSRFAGIDVGANADVSDQGQLLLLFGIDRGQRCHCAAKHLRCNLKARSQ